MDSNTRRELDDLLSALLDGALTPAQQDRLDELLRHHPQARDLYLAYFALHADLALRSIADCGLRIADRTYNPQSAIRNPQSEPPGRRLIGTAVGLTALAAALLLALAYWPRSGVVPDPPPGPSGEPTHQTIAVLLQAVGAEWEETGLPTRAGAPLPAGRLVLKAGLAQIEFYSGATVILEGPADFELISARVAFCRRGRLRATVPPQAQGFAIRSPKLDLVDRGTEFGLAVGDDDRTEVHVFQGLVEVYDADSDRDAATRRELATGQGVRLDGPRGVQLIASAPDAFRTARNVATLSEEEARRRHDAWQATSKTLRHDPSLVVYYPFQAEPSEPSWSRALRDQAGDRRRPHDGTIVGCSWVDGRWPGKQALEFKQVGDRVRVHVPAAFDSLTLMAWVRVDALANGNNSLFLTDGWEVGGVHWQIGEAGKLVLGVKAPPGEANGQYHAHGVFTPERFGQWVHLAVVYDRDRGRVTHYVDGSPAGTAPTAFEVPLRIGNAEIGNWNIASYTNRQPIRNFSGRMDEFLIFSRALTDDHVRDLYAQGKRWVAKP